MLQKLLAVHKAGQLQFFRQHTHLAERKAFAACWRRRATSKPTTAPSRSFWRTFGLGFFVYVTNFSRNSDRLGDLPVADLRLRGLDQRRDPPYRGHARSRPCAPPLRCRSRSAARSSTSRTSTTVRHEQRLDPPP